MTWRDREHDDDPYRDFGRPGGDWQGMHPRFDNPLSWSLLVGRVAGIAVRVHWFFLAFVVIMLLRAGPGAGAEGQAVGFAYMAIAMAALWVIVLVHEFGHCLACRASGGTANEILMWPLGGLAYCQPPNRWQAHLATVLGGPLVNVVIGLIAGIMLLLVTGRLWGVAIPNPLDLHGPIREHDLMRSWSLGTLYLVQYLNVVLLLFNLLPIYPFDGGRIVQAALWSRLGYARSMRVAVRTGLVGAIVLGVFGAVASEWLVVGIACFGGITCYISAKQLAFTESFLGFEDDSYAISAQCGADDDPVATKAPRTDRAARRAARQADQQAAEAAEVDRILTKIRDHGMESLSGREKRLLRRATERRRQQR
ncbi:MAG: site-2 protease family protein [Planctomycetota bacterium]|jgi:Zn-dependent protease